MKYLLFVLLLFPWNAYSQEANPQEIFKQLSLKYRQAMSKFRKQVKQAREKKQRIHIQHPRTEFTPKFMQFANDYPNSSSAFSALVKVLYGIGYIKNAPERQALENNVLEKIRKNHINNSEFAGTYIFGRMYSNKIEPFLRDVIAQTTNTENKYAAMFYLAEKIYLGQNDKRVSEAIKLFEQAHSNISNQYIKSKSKGYLYEIRNLQIGMKAPEISGKDINNIEMRLSQFSGKVVMLSFWGNW